MKINASGKEYKVSNCTLTVDGSLFISIAGITVVEAFEIANALVRGFTLVESEESKREIVYDGYTVIKAVATDGRGTAFITLDRE